MKKKRIMRIAGAISLLTAFTGLVFMVIYRDQIALTNGTFEVALLCFMVVMLFIAGAKLVFPK